MSEQTPTTSDPACFELLDPRSNLRTLWVGEELRNTSGGVTFDLRRLRPGDHDRYLNGVLNGKSQMPPWRGALEPDQIEAIWAYIRSINDR